MDRQIVYPGQIPLETDLLNTNRNTMIALGKLAGAIFGTSNNVVNGLSVVPTTPASLSVNVNAGEIYSLQNVDNTAYSSLPADTTDTVVKQGIQLQPVALSCPAPTTAGFSINYLIEAAYQDADTASVVLPYYNASNPSQAYSGPNNSGTAQATSRQGKVVLQAKAGIAAATGSQTTPAVDAGYVALAVVTVANGQSTITSGNIVAATSGQLLSQPVSSGRLLNIQVFASSGTYTPTPGTNNCRIRSVGAGGGSGGCAATSASQVAASGGGGSGQYGEVYIPNPGVQTVTIGAGGSAGLSTGGNGGNGGNTSLGTILVLIGGNGGSFGPAATPPFTVSGANATSGGTLPANKTLLNVAGVGGTNAVVLSLTASSVGGGGTCPIGVGQYISTSGATSGYGSGPTGRINPPSSSAISGFSGANGLLIIEEYA